MSTTPLDMKYIYKRKRCLNNSNTLTESVDLTRDIVELSKTKSSNTFDTRVCNYISECKDYRKGLALLEMLYKEEEYNLIEAVTQSMIQYIIPSIRPIYMQEAVANIRAAEIGDIEKTKLVESVKEYKAIDRILKNHKNLTKRFNVTGFGKNGTLYERCSRIANFIDTYNISNFVKFNIALEEIKYLTFQEGLEIPEEDIVEAVVENFLLRSDNTKEDIESYKSALENSRVLHKGADAKVKYFTEAKTEPSTYWRDRLNSWLINPKTDTDKSISQICELAQQNLNNLTALSAILEVIGKYWAVNQYDADYLKIITSVNEAVSGPVAHNILSLIEDKDYTTDYVESLRMIWEAETNETIYDGGNQEPQTFTSDEIDKFKLHNLVTDAMDAGEIIEQIEKTSMKETPLIIDKIVSADPNNLEESNFIDYIDGNGYITRKLAAYNYIGSIEEANCLLDSTVKTINNILFNKDSIAFYTLGEDYFDIGIRSRYKIILTEAQEKQRGFSYADKAALCNLESYVQQLQTIQESKLNAILEKVLTDRNYAAEVTPEEASLVYEMISPYVNKEDFINEFVALCKDEANPRVYRIKKDLIATHEDTFNIYDDHALRIGFCAQILGLQEKGAVPINAVHAIDKAKSNLNKATSGIRGAVNKAATKVADKTSDKPKQVEEVPKEEPKDDKKKEAPKKEEPTKESKPEEKEEDKDADEKALPTKKEINSINDLKLAWQGVKAKAKGMSAKEQEMSRDLDIEFNHLCKTIQSTYSRDYRSEIITGEVNHSLSKIIKIAIGLAGLGVVTGGLTTSALIAPAIGAVLLFAKSKHTSNKEKKMILDEIDIELQVLEREINRAESSGSTKKYRQLLTIQKNLQRRRQEIYYDLGKHGKRVPMQATTGLRSRE